MQSDDTEVRITVEVLAEHIREHGIKRFLELMRVVGAPLPKGRVYVTGLIYGDRQVAGLHLVNEEEAGTLKRHYFLLGFDFKDGEYHLNREGLRAAPSLKKALL